MGAQIGYRKTVVAIAATLAFGLPFSGTKLMPSARADPPKPIPTQPADPKEAETPKAPKPLDPELAKLKKVSLSKLQKLDKENEKYTPPYEPGLLDDGSFITFSRVVFEGKTVTAFASMMDLDKWDEKAPSSGNYNKELGIIVEGVGVEWKGAIDLNPLDKLYQKATGNALRYVKLILESGKDEGGAYITVIAVPVQDFKNTKITDGIPVSGSTYMPNTGEFFSGLFLIANDVAPSK